MSELFNDIFSAEQSEHSEMYDILRKLLTAEDDLDLKTEIRHPEKIAVLRLIGDEMKEEGLAQSSKIIELYVNYSFRHAFSKDRKSRAEIIESVKSFAVSQDNAENNENKNIATKIRRTI